MPQDCRNNKNKQPEYYKSHFYSGVQQIYTHKILVSITAFAHGVESHTDLNIDLTWNSSLNSKFGICLCIQPTIYLNSQYEFYYVLTLDYTIPCT